MATLPCLLPLVFLVAAVGAQDGNSACYARNDNPYLRFGTKTAYEFVYHDRRKPENIPNCQPAQVWMLSRHGTRYPKRPEIQNLTDVAQLRDQILRNAQESGGRHLCWEDLEALRRWNFTVRMDQESLLTLQGRDDMKFLAMRFKTRYPGLLERPYSVGMYEFRYTVKERTKQSAEVFSRAMFGHSSIHFMEPTENDTLLRPYHVCDTWRKQVDENPETYKEMHLFEEGPEMQNLIQNVSSRLGFRYKLNIHQINMMYDMCRYDKAWQVKQLSPWCAVFSSKELQLLEFREDLEYYYYSGYGNHLNVKLGCPVVHDMLEHFRKVEEAGDGGPQQPLGVFYFAHSATLQMALSQLGIARDPQPLTHASFQSAAHRRWKTSELSPFAANLAAVLYRCTDGERHRVMFYVSEKLVDYEGCDVGLCSWRYLAGRLGHVASGCDLQFCRDGSGAPGASRLAAPALAVAAWALALRLL
ncbi:multiple inositol polyphosphate phosphatase 1-like [Bacillus rossius redtenbacheri]|uniref:multiple inositol polyphosphate phosphatase 1-like n=1 Tax=Bacillus rossius redtenbacheri TaxID=93214 RepID=UPI002FDE619B